MKTVKCGFCFLILFVFCSGLPAKTLVIWNGQMIIDLHKKPARVWLLPTPSSFCGQSCLDEAREIKSEAVDEKIWKYKVPENWFKIVDFIQINAENEQIIAGSKMRGKDLTVFYPMEKAHSGKDNRICRENLCGQLYKVNLNKILRCKGADCP
jgi:hypothetical protein